MRVNAQSCQYTLNEFAGAAGHGIDARRIGGPRHQRREDVLARQRHGQAGVHDRDQQLVVVDLAEARTAVLVLRRVAVVLDAEARTSCQQAWMSGIGSSLL